MCKEWLCSRKEWSGCFVKRRVLGDNSCWAPKSCFSLVLLLNVNVGHGSNAIFHSHSSELKLKFLVCLPYKQDKLLSLHGIVSLKHYILLGKGLLFFLPIHSAGISLHFRHHLVTGSIKGNELSNKNNLHLLRAYYGPGIF